MVTRPLLLLQWMGIWVLDKKRDFQFHVVGEMDAPRELMSMENLICNKFTTVPDGNLSRLSAVDSCPARPGPAPHAVP